MEPEIDPATSRIAQSDSKDKIKVLVVDDEEAIQQLLRSIIEQTTEFPVDVASSGEEAFKCYKKDLHQLIILDIRLGGDMNGIELLKRIKKHDAVANVIMITAYGSIDIAVECMKEGAWDFIPKPFTYDHFELVLNRAAENFRLKNAALERDYFLELSRIDGLTEIYNHRLFHIILNSELARGKRYKKQFTLLFFDVNDFKSINDSFGHQKGDELLKMLAHTMKRNSRESDLLFRYGGDEFAIILPETGKEGAMIFAKRLNKEIEKLKLEGETISGELKSHRVTISIGAAVYPKSGADKDALIRAADMAMLEAKKKSRRVPLFR